MEDKEKNRIICPYANMQSCTPDADDEINLFDILKNLGRRRFLITWVTVLVTSAASVLAFYTPKIFETKVIITPSFDLGLYGVPIELKKVIPDSSTVFKSVIENLQDKNVQAQFWDENGGVKHFKTGTNPHSGIMSKALFLQNLSIKKNSENKVSVSLSGGDPEAIVEVLNDFIIYLSDYSRNKFTDSIKLILDEKKLTIKKQIEMLRKKAEKNRRIRITELLEQIAIAEKLEIIEMHENLEGKPLYARGVKALQAEIDIMRQRKNKDDFIEGHSLLQEQLSTIDKADLKDVSIFSMRAGKASIPEQVNKFKQLFIVALGLILGLMVGLTAAFFINIMSDTLQKENEA